MRRSKSYLGNIRLVYLLKYAFIIQNISKKNGHNLVIDGLYENILNSLIKISTVTWTSDALDLHEDEPKSNPILRENDRFGK